MEIRKIVFAISVLICFRLAGQETVLPAHPAAMLKWLDTTSYFFSLYADTTYSEPVWKGGIGRADLKAIAADTALTLKQRFLAAEILFARDTSFPEGMDLDRLGKLYATALDKSIGGANEWGKPFGNGDYKYGFIGPHLLRIGPAAVPALAALLKNEKKMYYAGGDKSTEVPNSYRLRIKDFAAFYICTLKGWRYHCYRSPKLRNCRINKLKRKLNVH